MSRSYRKISCGKSWNIISSFGRKDILCFVHLSIPDWSVIRMKERKAIHDELTNPEYGDAIFPKYHGCDRSSWFSIPRRHPLRKKHIRENYFLEIRSVLNGVIDEKKQYDKLFMEDFLRIKCVIGDGGKLNFEWLNFKTAKKITKEWKSKPLDILKYLTDNGCIERAVLCKFRKSLSK